ncbi:MAG: hypothetical protein IJZ68_05800 [Bacteroidaceae bacterium]|nr:hypothetical protein [Bacteroidaceae bacterium]
MSTINKIRNMTQGCVEMRAHTEVRQAAKSVGFGKPCHIQLTMAQLQQNSKYRQEEKS